MENYRSYQGPITWAPVRSHSRAPWCRKLKVASQAWDKCTYVIFRDLGISAELFFLAIVAPAQESLTKSKGLFADIYWASGKKYFGFLLSSMLLSEQLHFLAYHLFLLNLLRETRLSETFAGSWSESMPIWHAIITWIFSLASLFWELLVSHLPQCDKIKHKHISLPALRVSVSLRKKK